MSVKKAIKQSLNLLVDGITEETAENLSYNIRRQLSAFGYEKTKRKESFLDEFDPGNAISDGMVRAFIDEEELDETFYSFIQEYDDDLLDKFVKCMKIIRPHIAYRKENVIHEIEGLYEELKPKIIDDPTVRHWTSNNQIVLRYDKDPVLSVGITFGGCFMPYGD